MSKVFNLFDSAVFISCLFYVFWLFWHISKKGKNKDFVGAIKNNMFLTSFCKNEYEYEYITSKQVSSGFLVS